MGDPAAKRAMPAVLPALMVYAVLASIGAWTQREQINPDGVGYIQLARALGEGRVLYSVSANLSPMIIWSAAPLTAAGMDGQLAMRVVQAVWGGVFLIGFGALLGRFTTTPRSWKIVCLLCAVPVALNWSLRYISADIAVAACLAFYFSWCVHPRLIETRSAQLACGFWGGVAFLAKASALHFVLLSLPLAVMIRWWTRRRDAGETTPPSGRRAVAAWAVCLLVFAVVISPWVATLSWKMGRLTFTTGWPASMPSTPIRARRNPSGSSCRSRDR